MRTPRTLMGLSVTLAVVVALLGFAPSASATTATPDGAAPVTAPVSAQSTTTQRARGGCRVPYCYGALAINLRTGGSGYAYDYNTKKKALRHAKKSCANKNGKGCHSVIWRRNGCAAVAWRGRNGRLVEWAARHAFSKKAAIRKAKRAVRGKGKEKVWTWVCTSRR